MARTALRSSPAKSQAVVLASLLHLVCAHPSAVAGGRPTCGAEFDSPSKAYVIPDITEAWYLRRIATCASPYFWITWNSSTGISLSKEPLYIAVISPEIERFTDKLQFHAILFGPGLPEFTPPAGVPAPLPTGKELTPPESYDTCAFVDTNPVMRKFSDVVGGRCMEQLTLSADYKDPLRAGKTWDSWWLYSHEHVHADPGQYYLVSWLTNRAGQLTQGKYEVTMGPWVWSGYADKDAMAKAHEQRSTCSCATNVVSYLEQHIERLGSPPKAAFEAELPAAICEEGGESSCVAANAVSRMDGVEWSGIWSLEQGSYQWTFYAFGDPHEYPDRNMSIVARKCTGLEDAQASAHDAMQGQYTVVQPGGKIAWSSGAQVLLFNGVDDHGHNHDHGHGHDHGEGASKDPFTQFELDVTEAGTYCIFTQHVPAEFLATYLFCSKCEPRMKFPETSSLYVLPVAKPSDKPESHSLSEKEEQAASLASIAGHTSVVLFAMLCDLSLK